MTELVDAPVLDQIVFRWSQRSLTGRKGVGPVAASLPTPELELWDKRLNEQVWALAGDADAEAPAPAGLSFLAFGEHCAVMHKVPVPDASGRAGSTLAHVLIGRGLHPLLALGLHDWSGWVADLATADRVEADGALDRVLISTLREAATDGLHALRQLARAQPPEPAAELLSHVLTDPTGSFSVVDADRPLELVCALLDIVGYSTRHPLTFSTREGADTGRELPRIVFLSGTSGFSTRGANRRRLRLGEADPTRFAMALVGLYARAGDVAVQRLRPARYPATAEDVAHWVEEAQLAPGVLASVEDLLVRVGTDELSTWEATFLAGAKVDKRLARLVNGLSGPELASIVAAWRASPQGWDRFPALADLVHQRIMRDDTPIGDGGPALSSPRFAGMSSPAIAQELASSPRFSPATLTTHHLTDLVRHAQRLGVTKRDQVALVRSVARDLPTWELLRWVHYYAAHLPESAEIVLAAIATREDRSRDRSLSQQIFLAGRGFVDAVERIHPQGTGAVRLYDILVDVVFGGDLKGTVIEDVLAALGPRPAPALLYVLHDRAHGSRARALVADFIVRQYFQANGLTAGGG
jgi:hypothetical protein